MNPSEASLRREILRLSHAGLDSETLRAQAMRSLRRRLPIDSFWFATADPATLLFTGSLVEAIPEAATPLFVANEFFHDDVNKWVGLARARPTTASLYQATGNRPEQSPRYRDILAPLGFGDELRAVLRSGDASWGFMCLHREKKGPGFSRSEIELLASLGPHLAQGLRAALLIDRAAASSSDDEGPGLLLLAEDHSLLQATPAGRRWLYEIADRPPRRELPEVVYAVAARLAALESAASDAADAAPRARVRTRSGGWLMVHAARLSGRAGGGQTAILLEPARPHELAPLLLAAHGLTPREAQVAQLVLHGVATAGIASALRISDSTVQQHLKSVFDKIGVGSRRALVAQIFTRHYRPRLHAAARRQSP